MNPRGYLIMAVLALIICSALFYIGFIPWWAYVLCMVPLVGIFTMNALNDDKKPDDKKNSWNDTSASNDFSRKQLNDQSSDMVEEILFQYSTTVMNPKQYLIQGLQHVLKNDLQTASARACMEAKLKDEYAKIINELSKMDIEKAESRIGQTLFYGHVLALAPLDTRNANSEPYVFVPRPTSILG